MKNEKISSELNLAEENKTGPWDKSEDERLTNWVAKNGARNWAKCAKEVKTRNGKQCREHWKNKLNENIEINKKCVVKIDTCFDWIEIASGTECIDKYCTFAHTKNKKDIFNT